MKKLNLPEVTEIANGTGTILFITEDCEVCKKLTQELTNRVNYGYYEIIEDELIVKQLKILSVPTLIYFEKGKPKTRLVGLFDLKSYERLDKLK